MRRRDFLVVVGSAAATWPIAAHGQRPMSVIGLLHGGSPEGFESLAPPFRQGLNEGGYVEGRNLGIESRWARGQFDHLPELAADLIRHRPAVIATGTLPGALAAKAATATIPVVFIIGEDPIKAGLVTSLNRPGGNVTGMSNFMNVLGAKRLELVSEAVPKEVMLALLVNPNNPNADPDTKDLRAAADALGRRLMVLTASNESEIEIAFAAAGEKRIGALFVNIDPFLVSRGEQLVALAALHRVPTIYPFREMVAAGGLMSYGASFPKAWRQSGLYVARILKGAKPAELPVLQPTNLELAINLRTAKALGLTVPPTLLARADEVIE
jgi:putative ABC transport system substrate-binding protein